MPKTAFAALVAAPTDPALALRIAETRAVRRLAGAVGPEVESSPS